MLPRATAFSRFAHGDLGSIADGLRAAPRMGVAEAEPLQLEGLPKVAVRSSADELRRQASASPGVGVARE